jgi:hypothetical protein
MGLDNIPKEYPCKKNNMAVFDDEGRISCEKTINIGQCPLHNLKDNDLLVRDANPVYGVFGTDCWYRGKYGNMLLSIMDESGYRAPIDFFGENHSYQETPPGLSPANCLNLSDWMNEHIEVFTRVVKNRYPEHEAQSLIKDWMYASWWLRFVAKFANGSDVWY